MVPFFNTFFHYLILFSGREGWNGMRTGTFAGPSRGEICKSFQCWIHLCCKRWWKNSAYSINDVWVGESLCLSSSFLSHLMVSFLCIVWWYLHHPQPSQCTLLWSTETGRLLWTYLFFFSSWLTHLCPTTFILLIEHEITCRSTWVINTCHTCVYLATYMHLLHVCLRVSPSRTPVRVWMDSGRRDLKNIW
jgi:hypothetical protein